MPAKQNEEKSSNVPVKTSPKRLAIISIVTIVVVFTLFRTIIGITSSPDTSSTQAQAGHDNIEVCVEAQHYVTELLKSPSTAKFPTCNDTSISQVSPDHYRVSAYVDSQNGFGAMLRSDWTIEYHYVGATNVQLDTAIMDGKTVYGG